MPESVSGERVQLLEAFRRRGRALGRRTRLERGHRRGAGDGRRRTTPSSCPTSTGTRPTRGAHYETTAPEILRDLPDVTHFVAGLGTGGTLTGVGPLPEGAQARGQGHRRGAAPGRPVQGLRSLEEGFIPPVLDESVLDGRIVVDSRTSFATTKELTQKEGIFAGISAGAVVKTAQRVAERLDAGKIVAAAGRRRLEVPLDQPVDAGLRRHRGPSRRQGLVVAVRASGGALWLCGARRQSKHRSARARG